MATVPASPSAAPPTIELPPEQDTLGLAAALNATAPWGHWACPCGHERYGGLTEAHHAAAHLRWAAGIQVPRAVGEEHRLDTLLVVRPTSPRPLQQLTYDLARLFQREGGYDFAAWPAPARGGWRTPAPLVAYLALFRARAIAFVLMDTAARWGTYGERDAEGRCHFDQAQPLRAIGAVFVGGNYRRHGVGRRLVHAACTAEGQTVRETPWHVPFSAGGLALAQSLTPAAALRVC